MPITRLARDWFGDDSPQASQSAVIAGNLDGQRILAPLLTDKAPVLTDQIKVAATLARPSDSALQITNPITVPEQTPLRLRQQTPAKEDHELLDWALTEARNTTRQVNSGLLYTRRLVSGVLQTIATNDVDTVVLPGADTRSSLTGEATEHIARRSECDAIVVNGMHGFDAGPSILLSISGGPHSGVATDVATRIAGETDAWIDILHVIDDEPAEWEREQAEEYVDAAYQRIARPDTTSKWILEAADPIDSIIEQSRYYPLTVIGAPTKGRLRCLVSGSTNRSIRSNAQSVVLSARNNTGTGNLDHE